ncbi:MAG: hypothetical protein WKG07_05055 [Hymenobacter sp.]
MQTPWSGTNAQRVALAQLAPSSSAWPQSLTQATAYPNPAVGSSSTDAAPGAARSH